MIQNLMVVKKGIPGFVYAAVGIESEDVEESIVTVEEGE